MNSFISGFITGLFLKNKLFNVLKGLYIQTIQLYHQNKPLQNKIKNKSYFICKITNTELFHELFPDYPNTPKVQPYWEYYPNKQVIKIKLDDDVFNFEEFKYKTTLDLDFFKKIGKVYIYVDYYMENKKFTNIYHEEENTLNVDLSKYNSIICATIKHNENLEYITKYFKQFLNNKVNITPELLLLHYDKLDINLTNTIQLHLVNTKNINICSLNESI